MDKKPTDKGLDQVTLSRELEPNDDVKNHKYGGQSSSRLPKLLAVLPIPISLLLLGALSVLNIKDVFEPLWLLPLLNTAFLSAIPFVIFYITTRAYLGSGSMGLFMLGCGVLALGLSAFIAGVLIRGMEGPNTNVTIFNCGALLAAGLHFYGAASVLIGVEPELDLRRKKMNVISAYLAVFILIGLLVIVTANNLTPLFFIQGVGPTLLRQIVLGGAIGLFAVSAFLLTVIYLRSKANFLYWYSLALFLIAIGLACVFFQKAVGSPIGWLGRSAQYLGCIYLLVAILSAVRDVRGRGVILEIGIARFFQHRLEKLVQERTEELVRVNKNLKAEIEKRKRVEEVLKEAGDELEQRVEERTSELAREIEERKQAEAALRESEEKYRSLVESTEDSIYLLDKNCTFLFTNKKYLSRLGVEKEKVTGKNYAEFHSEDDSKELAEKVETVFKTGKSLWYEYRSQRDGRYFIRTLSPVKGPDRTMTAVTVNSKDITERKQAEEKRAKLETQLQQAKKMETIGILAGGVAHDLNNILSGIVSYPELLLMDLPEDSPLRKPLLTIKGSGEKAAVVVQDLLTLARRGVTITEIVNLNSIISEQLKSPEYEKLRSFHPNVDIETNLEKDLLNIKGSTAHLSKTVMNLISNAAEAMPDGGKVLVSTENLYIDRPIRGYDHVAEGDYVVVTVIDTGIGISKEDIERIFEPFYTKKVMGRSGSGLGMSVVWGTVKDHNGYIDVKSIKGKGTTFTLYFPVIREELAIDKSLLSIEDYMGKGESILIVDDVGEQREIASVMLKKLGYSVKSVSSGEEAIEYMKDNSADLLVLDMIMDPGIDGLETYKRILKLHPKQKAIIASGFSETDRVKEAKRLGAGAYVKKPYVLEKIGLAIKEELEK